MSKPPGSAADEVKTVVVDGLALAKTIRSDLADQVQAEIDAGGRAPCLAVVLVGDDPGSLSYIKGKQRACARVNMTSVEHRLSAETSQAELLELIQSLNADDGIDGILVQVPLPKGISPEVVAEATDPTKDADGIHPLNFGKLVAGTAELIACTPLGVMAVLDHYDVSLEGANAVVIGRSAIVGKPVSFLLQQRHATVTMCHSRTRDLARICREADVIVAAVGSPRMVKADWICPGAVVIDVGVTDVDGELVGDVDFEAAQGIASLITPSRRGIGPMTITMLLRNTLQAYRARRSS